MRAGSRSLLVHGAWLGVALVGALLSTVACTGATEPSPLASTVPPGLANRAADRAEQRPSLPEGMPESERWKRHMRDEILPFWMHDDALGNANTGFPTFRCNDGSAYDASAPCPEMTGLPEWIASEIGTEYTRMKSRQTFLYGVGFHMTGDPALLERMRAGVEFLRTRAYERDTGSVISYWKDGKPGPRVAQRTTQDLAYAQLGLAMYYYLTREQVVLDELSRLKEHIFITYGEPSWRMLRWVREKDGDNLPEQQELVSQLDQINAYMLLVTPLLDEPIRSLWLEDMLFLARVMRERYFAAEHGLFWGAVHNQERMQLGSRHTDFGHSSKALWMLRMVGALAQDQDLVAFADEYLPALAERAYNPETGCWGDGISRDGEINRWTSWWTAAELDQAVATLALVEPRHVERYLVGAYQCWLTGFVDQEHGGIWPFVGPDGKTRGTPIKQHQWKNGYHEAEHALIGYITTAALEKRPVTLYYAFERMPSEDRIQPYLYRATIRARKEIPLTGDERGQAVTFENIGLGPRP